MKAERRAWLTFLSSNNYYIYLLLGLYKNLLDTSTKYPFYCGVTQEVNESTKAILKKVGINVIELNINSFSGAISKNITHTIEHYKKAFTKLALLDTLVEEMFDKIVYLDTDISVLSNIDDLFDKLHMSAVADQAPVVDKIAQEYKPGNSIFCSGLFVWDFKHNKGVGHNIIENLNNLDMKIAWHDQSVLNFYYNDWNKQTELHLSPAYCIMNSEDNFKACTDEIKAIHYVGRLRDDWPFNYRKLLTEKWWRHGCANFVLWVAELAKAIEYFNETYAVNVPPLHPENLICITKEQEKAIRADGNSNCYLYF